MVVETQGEENGHQATGVPQRQKEIAGALVGEQKILEKLELEIRRCAAAVDPPHCNN